MATTRSPKVRVIFNQFVSSPVHGEFQAGVPVEVDSVFAQHVIQAKLAAKDDSPPPAAADPAQQTINVEGS